MLNSFASERCRLRLYNFPMAFCATVRSRGGRGVRSFLTMRATSFFFCALRSFLLFFLYVLFLGFVCLLVFSLTSPQAFTSGTLFHFFRAGFFMKSSQAKPLQRFPMRERVWPR